jgi:hypothetical protein
MTLILLKVLQLRVLITEEQQSSWQAILICHLEREENSETKAETFTVFYKILAQAPGLHKVLRINKLAQLQN